MIYSRIVTRHLYILGDKAQSTFPPNQLSRKLVTFILSHQDKGVPHNVSKIENMKQIISIYCLLTLLYAVYVQHKYKNFYRYNMTTGRYPFEGDNVYRLLEAIGRGEPAPPPSSLGSSLQALLIHMLKRNPDERPTVQEIRRHE